MGAVLLAIAGYAIGTAQVLLIDWEQRRREHIRQLRLVRAELRRAGELVGKFGWSKGVVPGSDEVPYPPRVSEQFIPTVASINYYLTDEHDDDNAQFAHLTLIDSINHLRTYHDAAMRLVADVRGESDKAVARQRLDRAVENAQTYDKEVDRLAYIVSSALADLDRRLEVARFRSQLRRLGRRLPTGENPPPLKRDDHRLMGSVEREG